MAPHSSALAWKIPWTEEPGRLQSMGSWRVRHDWANSLSFFTFMHWKWQPTPAFLPGESQGQWSLGATVCGVTQSRTRLKWLSNSSSSNVNLVLFHTVHGVLQARILEWVAISFSSGPYVVRILHYDLSILGGLHDMAHGFTELHKLLCQDKADPWRGWPNLGRQWRTEEPGVLQHMGSHSLGHDLVTEQQYSFFSGLPSVIVARQSWQS